MTKFKKLFKITEIMCALMTIPATVMWMGGNNELGYKFLIIFMLTAIYMRMR